MALFQNKYRTQSIRFGGYDYSAEGFYFVTVCAKGRICCFGDVRNGELNLNEVGKEAQKEWLRTGEIRRNVLLDEFIVMPDHVHGIICIQYQIKSSDSASEETHCSASLRRPDNAHQNKFGPQSNNLSSIIRGFKSAATKTIHLKFPAAHFAWQSGFYDRIIRNEAELNKIREYVINNPAKWAERTSEQFGLWT